MAKKTKKTEVIPESKWDGKLLTYIGVGLLQALVITLFCGGGLYVACSKVVGQGGPWYEDIQDPMVLATVLLGMILFGLGVCWANIIYIKWDTKHTVVSGQRFKFTASTLNLFFNCVKWTFLTIITCGIYAFWMPIKVRKWQIQHTVSELEENAYGVGAPIITYYTVEED